MVSTCLLLASWCLPAPVLAADEISGAFGFRLGTPVDRQRVEATEEDENGRMAYLVNPPNRRPPFRDYRLYLTAENTIHTIVGLKQFRVPSACRRSGDELVAKLTERHGEPVENLVAELGPARWTSGSRAIVLLCRQLERGYLMTITYTDSALSAR